MSRKKSCGLAQALAIVIDPRRRQCKNLKHHLVESLFHGRIGELIRYGRSRGAAMGLSTNATFLDERKGRALLDSGLDFLVISVDAASPEAYRALRATAFGSPPARSAVNGRAGIGSYARRGYIATGLPCRHRSDQKAEKRDETERERSGAAHEHLQTLLRTESLFKSS